MHTEHKEQVEGAGQQSLRSAQCVLRSCDMNLFRSGSTSLPCPAPAQPGHNLAEGSRQLPVSWGLLRFT